MCYCTCENSCRFSSYLNCCIIFNNPFVERHRTTDFNSNNFTSEQCIYKNKGISHQETDSSFIWISKDSSCSLHFLLPTVSDEVGAGLIANTWESVLSGLFSCYHFTHQPCLLVFLASSSADFPSEASLLLPHTGDQFVLPTGIHIFLIAGTASSRTLPPSTRILPSSLLHHHLSATVHPLSTPRPSAAESALRPCCMDSLQTNKHFLTHTHTCSQKLNTSLLYTYISASQNPAKNKLSHMYTYTNTQLSSCSCSIYSVLRGKRCRCLRLFSKGVPSLCSKTWGGGLNALKSGQKKKRKSSSLISTWE